MSIEWISVDEGAFKTYLNNYGENLAVDICGIYEPSLKTYNDFSLGKWPDSVVAKVDMYDGSDYHGGKTAEYFIPKPPEGE